MSFTNCPGDASFGPTVRGCRGNFDFTLTFEQIFFSIIPASLFILASCTRIQRLLKRPRIAGSRISWAVKLTAILPYFMLRYTLLILSCNHSGRQVPLFVASTAIEFVTALCILVLSTFEHTKAQRPSIILNTYGILALLLDVPQARSLSLAATNDAEHKFAYLFIANTVLRAVIIITESLPKHNTILSSTQPSSPEDNSGIFALVSFSWISSLFVVGYKNVLRNDDLFGLGRAMSTETLGRRLESHMKTGPYHLYKVNITAMLCRAFAVPLLLPIGPRLALLGFTFCQPFLIQRVLDYLASLSTDDASPNTGYGLIGATIFVYSGIAISTSLYRYLHERTLWMVRGALLYLIYQKTTQLPSNSVDESVLTLMSTDIERIQLGFKELHDFWASPIEIALASWMLFNQLGNVFLAPIVLVAICIALVGVLSLFFGARQRAWMKRIEERVGVTSKAIGNMKHLKIAGLAEAVEKSIQTLRLDEIHVGNRWRTLIIIATFIGFTPVLLGPVVTFALASQFFSVSKLFTSLSFLTFLTIPLTQLIQFIPPLLAAVACLDRIQQFLQKDARVDYRQPLSRRELDQSVVPPQTGHATAFSIKHGAFGWDEDKMVVRDVNLEIPSFGLTVIVGPVASGKSTLCKALLGETPYYKGQIITQGTFESVGFCDQTPFISNGTIWRNIVGDSPFDQKKYDEVIEAAMLRPDFLIFPQGDATLVGSNGVTLSGGQKQRLCIARALYHERGLIIFDDAFSGLDKDTRTRLFHRVFGPGGLLRSRKTTAIACTHSMELLLFADKVVALGPEGRVVQHGRRKALATSEGYDRSLRRQAAPLFRVNTIRSTGGAMLSPLDAVDLSPVESLRPRAGQASDSSRQMGDFEVYKYYAKSAKLGTVLAFVVVGASVGFLWNYPQVWLSNWATDVASGADSHPHLYWVGIYGLLSALCLLCIAATGAITLLGIVAQSGSALHHHALQTVMRAPLHFFSTTDAGVVTNLFSQDMTLLDTELPSALLNMVISVFIVIGMAAVVVSSSPYIAISYPFLAVLLWIVQRVYLRTSRQLRLLDLEAKSPLYTQFADLLKGLATIRAFVWEDASLKTFIKLVDASQKPAYFLAMIQHCLTFILQLVTAFVATMVVVLTTQIKLLTRAGLVGASLVTLMTFGQTVTILITTYTLLETSLGAVSRLRHFSTSVSSEDTRDAGSTTLPRLWPSQGEIKIENISASYSLDEDTNHGLNDQSRLALDELNMTIKPGEKVALCGRTGSGKSSIILLLLRLLDPLPDMDSSLSIDGIALQDVDRSLLRQRIIAVPQDPVFIRDSISVKANLDPHNNFTAEDCIDVLDRVGLWIAVKAHGGLDACLSTASYSQGQKQLFSLARAILRRRGRKRELENHIAMQMGAIRSYDTLNLGGVLLLDEVSASADLATEQLMHSIIRREFAEYTVITVTHQQGVAMSSDRVFVIQGGCVIESGEPQQLMDTQGSYFQKLWINNNEE
ncbi:multidrug resistance-associated protein [Trichoderma afarasin]